MTKLKNILIRRAVLHVNTNEGTYSEDHRYLIGVGWYYLWKFHRCYVYYRNGGLSGTETIQSFEFAVGNTKYVEDYARTFDPLPDSCVPPAFHVSSCTCVTNT